MLTAQEQLETYAKVLMNPAYGIETFLETEDQTQGGFVPFNLFDRQKEIVSDYENHRHNLVAKPRQAGISTTTAGYACIKCAFADSKSPERFLILANKQTMAFEFLGKIKDFLVQLPRWIWGPEYYGSKENNKRTIFLNDSKQHIKLPNGSEIKAVATSKDALRGFTPTRIIIDEAAFIDDGAIVYGAAMASLSCIVKDSLILTDNGLVTLDELVKEQEVLGFTGLDKPHMVCNKDGILTEATQTFVSEFSDTYRITTKTGVELEGSWKHPLYVDKDSQKEWVKMSELTIGDKVTFNYNQNLFGDYNFIFNDKTHGNSLPINIPKDFNYNLNFPYLLGLFVAEGNFHQGGINITNIDSEISNFLTNDLVGFGRPFKKVDDKHHFLTSRTIIKYFDEFGLKKHSAQTKEIPLAILKMSKPVVKNFLQGMFDGDGMSDKNGIKYSSTSKKLIKTLQVLLLNFGIQSHIYYSEQKTSESSIIKNKDHVCKIYNLYIYSHHAIKFYDEIGFRLNRKQINRGLLLNKKRNSDFIKVTKDEISDLLIKHGVGRKKVRFLERFWKSKYNRLSYESYNRLVDYIGDDQLLINLGKQIEYNKNYFIDEIVSIEKSSNYTYDLHVPNTNSFISNGLISHNTGGGMILISTPNGFDSLYYKTYDGSLKGENDFNIINMRWFEDPRYNKDLSWTKDGFDDIIEDYFDNDNFQLRVKDGWKPTSTWYREMCRNVNNDKRQIAQELDVSFLGSGGSVIDDEDIENQLTVNVCEPEWVEGRNDEFWIWKKPVAGHKYLLSSDVSRGDGEDSSTFVIIDFTTMEMVVEYIGKVMPDKLADIIDEYATLYDAYTVVDITGGLGVATVLKLIDNGFNNLHFEDPRNKLLANKKDLAKYAKEGGKMPGLNVNAIRLPMIALMEEYIREDKIKIRSERMISEMRTFIYRNGRPDHMIGFHDDLLMALAMGLWVLQHSFKNLEKLQNQTKAMLAGWTTGKGGKVSNDFNTGFTPKGQKGTITGKPKFTPEVAKNMQDPAGDHLWLFSGMG